MQSTKDIAALVAELYTISDSEDGSLSSDSESSLDLSSRMNQEVQEEDANFVRQEEGKPTRRKSNVSFSLPDAVVEIDAASKASSHESDQISNEGESFGKYGSIQMVNSSLPRTPSTNSLDVSGQSLNSSIRRTASANSLDVSGQSLDVSSRQSLSASSVHLRMSRRHQCIDEDILHRAAADAGVGSLGTVYVEVWALSEDGTQLIRPEGGYWMDPIFHNAMSGAGCCGTLQCSACKISDPDHPNFLPADSVAPGVGLAGVLWSESTNVEDSALSQGGGRLAPTSQPATSEPTRRRFSFHRKSETSHTVEESGPSEFFDEPLGMLPEEEEEEHPTRRPSRRLSDMFGLSSTAKDSSSTTDRFSKSLSSFDDWDGPDDTAASRRSTGASSRRSSIFGGAASRRSTGASSRRSRRSSIFEVAGDVLNSAGGALVDLTLGGGEGGGLFGHQTDNHKKVIWRDVLAMANNPHLPYDERLHAIAQSGIGWAAGVPFHVNHHKGIVIYAARRTVDQDLLKQSANEDYMLMAANLIGSAYALRIPRRMANQSRKANRDAAFRRCKLKILTLIRLGAKFDHTPQKVKDDRGKGLSKAFGNENSAFAAMKRVNKALVRVAKKCKGSNNKPPPPFSNDQAFFTTMGSLCVISLLSGIGNFAVSNYGYDYLLLMPPFGAFICLQFSLTQAPAAQPRNCLVGQLLSISIALAVSTIPVLPSWFKQALGTSLAIGVMSRCGVTHPPAGAAAYLFASGEFGLTHFALLMGGNIVSILLGSVINNVSEKRQYPTYYAMGLNPKDMAEYLKR